MHAQAYSWRIIGDLRVEVPRCSENRFFKVCAFLWKCILLINDKNLPFGKTAGCDRVFRACVAGGGGL